MKTLYIATSILLCLALASCEPRAEQGSELVNHLNEYLQAHNANGRFSGVVLIKNADSTVAEVSIGFADVESNERITPQTRFMIGSITKPFIAEAVDQLVARGLLNYEDPLSNWYPQFPRSVEITIAQLVDHTSGLADYRSIPTWKEQSQQQIRPDETLAQMRQIPMVAEPGERFRYSNVGYIFLGRIIEMVTEKDLEVAMQELVFEPFDLPTMSVRRTTRDVEGLATGYTTVPGKTVVADWINLEQPFASGNMVGTAADLASFIRATHATRGWRERRFDGAYAVGHTGRMNGFTGSVTYIESMDATIVILTNDDNTAIDAITTDLVSIAQGMTVDIPQPEIAHGLDEQERSRWVGTYLIKEGDTLHVSMSGGQLQVQETGQAALALYTIAPDTAVFGMLERRAIIDDSSFRLVHRNGTEVRGRTLPY